MTTDLNPETKCQSGYHNGVVITMDKGKKEKDDPFDISNLNIELDDSKPSVVMIVVKVCCVIVLLYIFICSLDFMGTAFKLISGKTAGEVLQNDYLKNPIVGLMIGILVTVLVQSSSTSTSIFVSMVNAQILQVHAAIPMIFGSNVGTSVTNTIVSLTQIADKSQFRRAFAGATVHDMFNWLSVIVLLTLEVLTGMLEKLTKIIVDSAFNFEEKQKGTKIKILKHITEPFTKFVIQIDKKVINAWSQNDSKFENLTLNPCQNVMAAYPDNTELIESKCDYLFSYLHISDSNSGIILLVISLVLLCLAMICIVKILSSLLKGTIAVMIRKIINADIPYIPWITGYIAIAVGAIMTVIVQSSSIFTSTLTPLIGIGLISLDRCYPLTLGSNIGTTTTAVLASIAGEGIGLKRSVQIALVHLFFNIFGIMIFYPLPFMRFPIPMAKFLGNTTAEYRWFAFLYLAVMFFLFPAFIFGLSLSGNVGLYAGLVPIIVLLVLIILINVLQSYIPRVLPNFLQNWNFLPEPLRSLAPYDRIITAAPCCKSLRHQTEADEPVIQQNKENNGVDNPSYQSSSHL